PAGRLADKIGKRKVVLMSYLLFALTCVLFANIVGGIYLWIAFAIYGIFIGFFDGVSKAYVSELVTKEKHGSALGLYYAVSGVAIFPASLIGGIIWDKISASTAFYYGAIVAVVAAVLLIILKKK
ncbi:MFS transporter, partial [Candidatus Woesearchaeota archaeon]|nr:MFS transporter [Candidatus Woesearchaeota archaeon]